MSIRLKIFLFVVWGLILLFLLFKMKTRKTDIRFILPWVLLDLALIVITAFPSILYFFCGVFGIETPSNMLFFFGMIFLAMIMFSMSLTISGLNEKVKTLTQRLALLEKRDEENK